MSARAGDRVSRATDAVTVAGFRVGWSLVRRMPERAAHALFDRIADLTVARGGGARLRGNYATVRPELDDAALDRLVREGMRAYMRYYCEAFRLPVLTPDELAARVGLVRGTVDVPAGIEAVLAAADGRPHWGKMHTRDAGDLARVYPRWDEFQQLRGRLDPDQVFTNPYLDRVLG